MNDEERRGQIADDDSQFIRVRVTCIDGQWQARLNTEAAAPIRKKGYRYFRLWPPPAQELKET